MPRIVQLEHSKLGRRVALVADSQLKLLAGAQTMYDWALAAIDAKKKLAELLAAARVEVTVEYDAVYKGAGEWKVLPAFDHPTGPAHCLITGTGLTHVVGARNRNAMHTNTVTANQPLTDSMRMFQAGVEAGRPQPGKIGVNPEWFYKGNGSLLRAHNQTLDVPSHGGDGGEEPEIAGCYLVGRDGAVYRVGVATGNEFSDHIRERKNYLYLAESKLRQASIGPELVVGDVRGDLRGRVSIERAGKEIWSAAIASGDQNMCHAISNLEHHHFKHDAHQHPGDVHIHFYGADAFSFGEGVALQAGDVMVVDWQGMGRPLRNPLRVFDPSQDRLVTVQTL